MKIDEHIRIHALSPASEGHSSFPAHGHPEQMLGRDKDRKGGKDKGGVSAGGPGSGRRPGDTAGGLHGIKNLVWECKRCGMGMYKSDIRRDKTNVSTCKDCGASRYGNIKADSAGTQTEGVPPPGAAGNRRYKVVDRMGRTTNSFDKLDEAKKASDATRYVQVKPSSGKVRDQLKDNPSDVRIDNMNKRNLRGQNANSHSSSLACVRRGRRVSRVYSPVGFSSGYTRKNK